jgi:hypothetical protein
MTGVAAAVESTTQAPDEPDLQPVFTPAAIDFIREGAAGHGPPRDAMCKPQHVGSFNAIDERRGRGD